MIQFKCSNCGAPMEAPDSRDGENESCPRCGHFTHAVGDRGARLPKSAADERPRAQDPYSDYWLTITHWVLTSAAVIAAAVGVSYVWDKTLAGAAVGGCAELIAVVLLLLRPAARSK